MHFRRSACFIGTRDTTCARMQRNKQRKIERKHCTHVSTTKLDTTNNSNPQSKEEKMSEKTRHDRQQHSYLQKKA